MITRLTTLSTKNMHYMKSLLLSAAVAIATLTACAQPASPPASASQTIAGGATVTIDYSQPSVKGRTIGKDLEPMQGKVWRAGANAATVFTTDKDVTVEGKALPAGKYSVFMIDNGSNWSVIFNKNWKIPGTSYEANKSADFLTVSVPAGKTATFSEKLTYTVGKDGKVSLLWGDKQIDLHVK
jgi:hypothetical protein